MNANSAISLKIIARWFAVLPGAVLCELAAQFPIHWCILFLSYRLKTDESGAIVINSWLPALPVEVLEYFANAFFTPFIIIAVGSCIAPNFKLKTGIAMSVLVGVFIGAIGVPPIASDIAEGLYTPVRWMRLAVTVVLWIVGISCGIFSAYLQAKEQATDNAT